MFLKEVSGIIVFLSSIFQYDLCHLSTSSWRSSLLLKSISMILSLQVQGDFNTGSYQIINTEKKKIMNIDH